MSDLRKTFGLCVRALRRRQNLTQEALAEISGLSLDMIAKIEGGSSGASFNTIEHLSQALSVEPAGLFKIDIDDRRFGSELNNLFARLAALSDDDLIWVKQLLDVALRPRGRR
ncbi:helix-turn-helix domain-containing protein [Rhizobium ruizarguesonis]|uniref:helix-turn-helix domain-containing protein n=1 Tax=Rhizobium ruizarguesonis TaxID=2081791 RepID=UPI00102F53A2|nr:helix-turn-helix transcriptional regulator [Rhizobium ruizarguesonis]TBA91088.1 XRE family transcriptional regulator [Rhizobium ruizarguesonis]